MIDLARLRAAQRVLLHAVRADGDEAITEAQASRYAALGLHERDGAQLAGADMRRIRVYRRLVRGGLLEAVEAQLERTVAHMGRPAYEHWLDRYCREALPRSQILRDVAYELVAWATPLWRANPELPGDLADVARFELLEFDVLTALRAPVAIESDELVADLPVAFDGTVRVARLDHAVHLEGGGRRGGGVLGYRDDAGQFRQLDLTPIATAIMGLLVIEGQPFAPAVQAACDQEGARVDQSVIDGTSRILADLAERGMVHGARAVGSEPERSPYFRWLYSESLGPNDAPSMLTPFPRV